MKRAVAALALMAVVTLGYLGLSRPELLPRLPAFLPAAAVVDDGAIRASGTIEAETVRIAAEVGGRIAAVHADRGDRVRRGRVLVTLDAATLRAQQEQLAAALATARANLAQVQAPPRPEVVAAAEAELDQALRGRDGTLAVWQAAQALADNPLELIARVTAARGEVAMLERQVEWATASLRAAEIRRDEAGRVQPDDRAATAYQAAIKEAEAAQAVLAGSEAELAGAREQLRLLGAMAADPVALRAQANAARSAYEEAEALVGLAQARVAAARAEALREEVAIARAQVRQAEAALARLEAEVAKTSVVAPVDGTVVERAVAPGEVAAAGATLLTLADLERLTLTVYVAEADVGRVAVGQPAVVRVDAYPGEQFAGRVALVAQEAEFTPRNVQTEDERAKLVFAVEVRLEDGASRLRPGMAADVEIGAAR